MGEHVSDIDEVSAEGPRSHMPVSAEGTRPHVPVLSETYASSTGQEARGVTDQRLMAFPYHADALWNSFSCVVSTAAACLSFL